VTARYEQVEADAFRTMAEATGLPLLRIAGATCVASPKTPRLTLLNRVTGIGIERDVADEELDEIHAFYGVHAERYAVALAPGTSSRLVERLRMRGLLPGAGWMKFARSTTDAPPERETELKVVEVNDARDFEVAGGEELPPEIGSLFAALPTIGGWHCFVAYDGAQPVARAALCTHGGGVGWLGVAGTLPEHRGRGAQTALLGARLRRAAELGLQTVVTETDEIGEDGPGSSYRNILRAGFQEAYVRAHLVSAEAS
jgi:GNAT superfamily N-acetyltransferase